MTSPRDEHLDAVAGLRRDVETAVREVGAEAALRHLPTDAVASLGRAKIVVVGEINSGKTSLINSLLGRPGLLPTTPTNTYVAVGSGMREELRLHLTGGTAVSHDVSEAAQILGPLAGEDITHAEILLDEPTLAELTLFDTPGVGGRDSAPTAVTLAALEHATALVFVTSAEAKISIAERNFLAEAAQRIQHVVFVMTKIDLLDDLGEANLHEYEATVRDDSSRFPPDRFANLSFVPFSAVLADDGLQGDADALADSGLAALWGELDRIARQANDFGELNALRSIKTALSEAYWVLAQRKSALIDPAAGEVLEAREALLRERGTKWRGELAGELRDARDEVRKESRRRIKAVREDYNARLTDARRVDVEATEEEMKRDLDALHADVVEAVQDRVVDIAHRLLASIPGRDAAVAASVEANLVPPAESPSEYLANRPETPKDPLEMRHRIQETYIFSNMFNSGKAMLDSYGNKVAQDGGAGTLLGFLVGAGVHAWGARRRKQFNDVNSLRAAFNTWVAEVSGELKADIQSGFERALYALQELVDTELRTASELLADEKRVYQLDVKDKRAEERRIESLKDQLKPLVQQWHIQHDALTALTAAPAAVSDRRR